MHRNFFILSVIFFIFCSCRSLFFHIHIFPFIPGLSDPQVGPRHQPSERSDGWHEGSGGGGGQGRQHRPGTPQGPGESWTVLHTRMNLLVTRRTSQPVKTTE